MSWRYKLNACDTRLMRETWHHSTEPSPHTGPQAPLNPGYHFTLTLTVCCNSVYYECHTLPIDWLLVLKMVKISI